MTGKSPFVRKTRNTFDIALPVDLTKMFLSLKGIEKGSKTEIAKEVGKAIAEKASANGIESVKFDRNGYLYHGRVKNLAEGAREGGLKF